MIRTYVLACNLPKTVADGLNRASGMIYTGVLVAHWRTVRHQDHWLSSGAASRWSDSRLEVKPSLAAHSIDAAQQGFYKACATTHALRKAEITEAKFPYHHRYYRTTVWKNTGIHKTNNFLRLATGKGNKPITVTLPYELLDMLRFLEVRLVYDRVSRKYNWHVVVENGKQPESALGTNVVSVDMGEIHPAVVGDEHETTIIGCRERRHEQQGHAKRSASLRGALSRTTKGSRRNKRLKRAWTRMNAKHKRVLRDMEHKISRAIVNVAVELKANTIVIGDVRDIADGVNLGKQTNQKISTWDHGQVRAFTTYKAKAEGMEIKLQNEAYTSQTCPNCGSRHKPRGRNYSCGQCGFSGHRDVVGQINILSAYKFGSPGKISAPTVIKHRRPAMFLHKRSMRRRQDTGQTSSIVCSSGNRETDGGYTQTECHSEYKAGADGVIYYRGQTYRLASQ